MSTPHRPTPNTYLGNVYWYHCTFWGTLEFLCQDMLGMYPAPPNPSEKFLDTQFHSMEHLGEFFDWHKLPDGRLGLTLLSSDMAGMALAEIETHFRYDEEVSSEDFKRLIDDFVRYARSRSLVDSSKREGADITDADLEEMFSRESPEQRAFWDNLPTTVHEEGGVPHWLWLESLDCRREKDLELDLVPWWANPNSD